MINRSTLKAYLVHIILFNGDFSDISTLTYNFIDKIVSLIRKSMKQYLRSILCLYKDVFNIFMLSLMNYRNSSEMNDTMDKMFDFLYLLFKSYKIGEMNYV